MMMDKWQEAYEQGVSHGWEAANYASAYGPYSPAQLALEGANRARGEYPCRSDLRAHYRDGWREGWERYERNEWGDGSPRD